MLCLLLECLAVGLIGVILTLGWGCRDHSSLNNRWLNANHRYNLQIDVINQLGQRIENNLKSHEKRLSSLPRAEASSLRTTHVKLTRDYRMVEQQFKNVQLDVKRRRGLAEARQREAVRMEEEEKERKRRGNMGQGEGDTMTEEGKRWQMQIQEDVSLSVFYDDWYFCGN